MGSSAEQLDRASAQHVAVTEDTLVVELRDGRTISVPVSWYPRLEQATDVERDSWELIGDTTCHSNCFRNLTASFRRR